MIWISIVIVVEVGKRRIIEVVALWNKPLPYFFGYKTEFFSYQNNLKI